MSIRGSEPSLAEALIVKARLDGREAHERVLTLVDDLTDDQLAWRPGQHAPSIGFHAWHLGRWADFDASQVTGDKQIWEARELAAAWGFATQLGQSETGTEMGDDASDLLVLPGKAELLDYVRNAFASIDNALDGATKTHERHSNEQVADLICTYLTHDSRHLGMIEALRGMLGLTGSATN
jgi:hypothetical protein